MGRWILLLVIVAFVVAQLARLRPSPRDQQLQSLREAASKAGLLVRFWTARQAGYTLAALPASAFSYTLPWPPRREPDARWALWLPARAGEVQVLAGKPPAVACEWLLAFREQFPGDWAVLEAGDLGLAVVWQERGETAVVDNLAGALKLLQKSL